MDECKPLKGGSRKKEMSQLPPLDQLIAYVGEKTLKTVGPHHAVSIG